MRNKLLILVICLLIPFIGWKSYQYKLVKDSLPSRKSLIQNDLEEKLLVYANRMNAKCEKEMLKVAKRNADSIVFIKANELMLFDSLQRPEKPIKPEFPEKKELKDSLAIKPLVKF